MYIYKLNKLHLKPRLKIVLMSFFISLYVENYSTTTYQGKYFILNVFVSNNKIHFKTIK